MSGALKKVLGVLAILLIGMLLLGAVINIFFPNVMTGMANAVEDSIYRMTNFKFDINGDGRFGSADNTEYGGTGNGNADEEIQGGAVEGFTAD